MGDADFFTCFHNLEGDLVGERKKSFNKLMSKAKLLNEQELNTAIDKIVPKNYIQNCFYLDTLLYFKKKDKLIELLKSGNQVYATKIVKQHWFLKEVFGNIEPLDLVNDFLPYLSFIVRKKLLNGLAKCWEENKIDKLFDVLDDKYGFTNALEILHKCSINKIQSILDENEIKLKTNQVIEILKKDLNLFKYYLKYFQRIHKTEYSDRKVIKILAISHPKLLLDLESEGLIKIYSVGRRTTKRIIDESKDKILNDVNKYINFLKKPALVRKCSPNFKAVYKVIVPDKFKQVNIQTSELLKHYPKQRRWDLFYTTCLEKFPDKSLKDLLLIFDTYDNKQLKLVEPPKEIMHQWALLLYEKSESNCERYLKYFSLDKGVKLLKEKINVASGKYKRVELIENLIDTCVEHNDMGLLEDVLKYICTRHRNEDSSFKKSVLSRIFYSHNLEDLNENHWNYINEILKFLRIQKEFTHQDIVFKHLEFLFKNNKDYKEVLENCLKDLGTCSFRIPYQIKNPGIKKQIYEEMFKKFPDIYEGDEYYLRYLSNFAAKIIEFSIENKDNCIDIRNYPYFVEVVKKTLDKTDSSSEERVIFRHIANYKDIFPQYCDFIEDKTLVEKIKEICLKENSIYWFECHIFKILNKKDRSTFGNLLLKHYLDHLFEKHCVRDVVSWLLLNEPRTLLPYFDKLLKVIGLDFFYTNYKTIRLYSHFEFDRKTLDYYRGQVEKLDEKSSYETKEYFKLLLILWNTEEFIKFVEEKFLPKKDKLDLKDDEMQKMYKIQCVLAGLLAKVAEPYKMLPTIMKFSKGDFLNSTLPSLYSAFYNSPQRILYPYIEQLSKQAVSVRKHAIFLSCAVLDKHHTMKLLKITNDSNISSQKHLFSATLNYFLNNPCEELLESVIDNLKTIDKNDIETLKKLTSVYIPTKYRAQYIEKCWYLFEKIKQPSEIKTKEYLDNFINYLSKNSIDLLTHEFINYVIKKYLPSQPNRLTRINYLAIMILKNRKAERQKNIELIFEIVSKFEKPLLIEFFSSFIEIVRYEHVDKDLIRIFNENWTKTFTIVQSLKEFIALKLWLLKHDHQDIEKFAEAVSIYLDQLVLNLSFLVINAFKEELSDVLNTLRLKERLQFYLALLKYKQDSKTYVIVIQIIDKIDDNDEVNEVIKLYNEIKDTLKNFPDIIVKAYYQSYFDGSIKYLDKVCPNCDFRIVY